MFLKSLTISTDVKVIREIKFREGINLIVDETSNVDEQETGNNVGKTTVLMLIDFCLGAKAKQIYTDHESKKEYGLVKDFLINNRVLITLVLKENLSIEDSYEVRLERNFLSRKEMIRRVDGLPKTEVEYEAALMGILSSGHFGKKPTFRQIISHNIRYSDLSIENTLKTLDRFTREDEYETLHLFLLGCKFDAGDAKQNLLTQIKVENTFKSRLEREQTKSAYETALSILESDIATLDRRKASFNLNENFESDLDSLNNTKYRINVVSSELGRLNIRRNLIADAERDIQSNGSEIDLIQLKMIYEQARSNINEIQKTFEDLHSFHNKMIQEKARYIAKELPELDRVIALKSRELHRLLGDEEGLVAKISRSESFEGLEILIGELNAKYQKKGEYENTIHQLSETESILSKLNDQLTEIDKELFSDTFEQGVKIQINKFNKYFSSISQSLYGEQYALKFDIGKNRSGQRMYKFSSFNTNFSSGKKQGEISCFDIAYTLFADDEDIPCFHFLLNDKKELMHDNQLVKIANLVDKEGIQFVASILQDKLPEELNKEEYFVVSLSTSEKLFRIENQDSSTR